MNQIFRRNQTSSIIERLSVTRYLFVLLAALAAALACPPVVASEWPSAQVGQQEIWDAAIDRITQTRFIPMQLIVPGIWDGLRQIDMPIAKGYDAEGTVWNGPQEWHNPYTDKTLMVYDRRRTTSRDGFVEQKMALREDRSAIGRVYDSRSGSVCDQEAKFPLGVWKQGEVRTYDYVCLRTVDGQVVTLRRTARITIEEVDYIYKGTAHSLRFAWRYADGDNGEILDHRTYIFSPGRGLVVHDRR
jgi:hypothetical protein